jgi:hypothetical protein
MTIGEKNNEKKRREEGEGQCNKRKSMKKCKRLISTTRESITFTHLRNCTLPAFKSTRINLSCARIPGTAAAATTTTAAAAAASPLAPRPFAAFGVPAGVPAGVLLLLGDRAGKARLWESATSGLLLSQSLSFLAIVAAAAPPSALAAAAEAEAAAEEYRM